MLFRLPLPVIGTTLCVSLVIVSAVTCYVVTSQGAGRLMDNVATKYVAAISARAFSTISDEIATLDVVMNAAEISLRMSPALLLGPLFTNLSTLSSFELDAFPILQLLGSDRTHQQLGSICFSGGVYTTAILSNTSAMFDLYTYYPTTYVPSNGGLRGTTNTSQTTLVWSTYNYVDGSLLSRKITVDPSYSSFQCTSDRLKTSTGITTSSGGTAWFNYSIDTDANLVQITRLVHNPQSGFPFALFEIDQLLTDVSRHLLTVQLTPNTVAVIYGHDGTVLGSNIPTCNTNRMVPAACVVPLDQFPDKAVREYAGHLTATSIYVDGTQHYVQSSHTAIASVAILMPVTDINSELVALNELISIVIGVLIGGSGIVAAIVSFTAMRPLHHVITDMNHAVELDLSTIEQRHSLVKEVDELLLQWYRMLVKLKEYKAFIPPAMLPHIGSQEERAVADKEQPPILPTGSFAGNPAGAGRHSHTLSPLLSCSHHTPLSPPSFDALVTHGADPALTSFPELGNSVHSSSGNS